MATVITIEILPSEILKIIFNKLSQNDVENCSKTCVKWQNIITSFKEIGKYKLHNVICQEIFLE